MIHTDDLQKIIDDYAPQIGDHFFGWVEQTLSDTDWRLFESAIDAGDFNQASRLIQWADYNPSALIGDTLGVAGQINADYITGITNTKYAFDLADPNAVRWAGEHGAELVQQIDEPTRAALKEVIHRGYFSGYTPREQATHIKGMVGLDGRRVKAVDNYMAALRRKGLSDEEISKKAEKYSDKLLKQRAKTIAVNEASEAATRGQYYSTKDACQRGVLDPQLWEEYRIVSHDERLCPICEPLAGEARRLPDGVYPSSGSVTTKLHVLCRCTAGLREINRKEGGFISTKKGQIDEAVESSADIVFEAGGMKETDEAIFVPTVPMVEGVFVGRGYPVLRLYSEFSQDARWFTGLPVMKDHADISPESRRIGQLGQTTPDPGGRRLKTTTEFIKADLTPRESGLIKSKGSYPGSLRYRVNVEHTPGTHEGTRYDAIERSPYVPIEYSLVRTGIVSPSDGAGFNMESGESPGGKSMATENENPEVDETKYVSIEEFEALKESLKGVSEKNEELVATLEANQKARDVLAFRDLLKPGHQDEAAKLLEAYAEAPIGWLKEHANKLLTSADEQKLKGKAVVEGASDPVEEAKKRAENAILRRKGE